MGNYEFDGEEQVIDRCLCCDNWVRRSATREVRVGERADVERWCIGCIEEVDALTLSLSEPVDDIPPPNVDI